MATVEPGDVVVQLELDGVWTDITSYVQRRESDLIGIERGMSEGATYADPATCTLMFNNRDGRFSPRNALGPYYGQLGKNTPIRVARRGVEDTYLEVYGSATDQASTLDSAALSITGDIDVRIDLRLDDWVYHFQELMGKWGDTGNQRGWSVTLNSGFPQISWSTAGTDATILNALATVRVTPPASGRLALRVTLDVNNGASGRTATFYTSDTLAGTWTQLGAAVTASGTTSIYDNTSPVEIGNLSDAYHQDTRKRVYGAEIRSGIGGTVVASPDFTAQTPAAPSFADAQGNQWTINGHAELTDRSYRFYGEVPAWPSRWDSTGNDVWVPVEASGVTRRLGQGSNPVQSTLFRAISNDSAVVAYWPCEDGEDASGISSATGGGKAMTIVGSPEYGAFSGFPSSKPIPTLNDSQWTGVIPRYTSTGAIEARFILDVPSGTSTSANQSIFGIKTTGSVNLWHLSYQAAGGLKLEWFNTDKDSSPSLGDSGVIAFGMNGKSRMVSVQLQQSGSNITWKVAVVDVGGEQDLGGTVSSRSLGRASAVIINNGGGIQDLSVGHINVRNAISGIFDLYPQLTAYTGEAAGARLLRLCAAQGVPIFIAGDPYSSTKMGPQSVDTFINLVRECSDADLGPLYEPRDMPGLAYRVREGLYNQAAAVTLDYADAELAGTLEPTDDDRLTRNDVTASRSNGGSYRVVDTESPLSVLPPPAGVGQYDTEVTLNLWQDEDTANQAGYRLRQGTINELRWTAIPVDLSRPAITGNPTLEKALLAADVGTVLDIENMPAWIPDDVSQLIVGYTETLGNKEHSLSFRGAPASAYTVGVRDTDRRDTAGSQLAAAVPEAGSSTVEPMHVSATPKIQSSSATVVSVTMPAVAAGHVLLIGVVWDSPGSVPTISSVVDSRSNTYTTTPDISINAGTTLATAIIRGTITTALQAGDTITITLSTSRARWAIQVDEFSGVTTSPLDKTASNTAASATAASGTTVATTADGELLYAAFGFGSGRTATLPAGWTGGPVVQTAAGSSDRCLQTMWSVAGASGAAQSVSIGLSSSSTYGGAIATYKPITVSATSLSVATTLGPLWTHADGDYDVLVAGERMTVTNVTGSSSPQTFAVTRAVNGISKPHSAGEVISLAAPAYRAL